MRGDRRLQKGTSYYDPQLGEYVSRYTPEGFYHFTGQPYGSAEGLTVALSDTTGDDYRWDQADPLDNYTLSLATGSDRAAQMFGLARSGGFTGHPGPAGTGGPDEILARSSHAAGVHVRPEGARGGLHTAHATAEGGRGRHLPSCPRGCIGTITSPNAEE